MKVVHLITGLTVGGAETMLLRLMAAEQEDVSHRVISLTGDDPVGHEIRAADVPVTPLGIRGIRDLPRALLAVRRAIRQHRPDVVQTWLYHADLVGGLAAWGLDTNVVWNLRHSDLSPERNKAATLWVVRACALLSRHLPTRIISCSNTAAEVHVRAGYDASIMSVIPNGFDTSVFRPSDDARRRVREELGLPEEAVLSGAVGRYHPQKDPETLIEAAAAALADRPEARLVLVGDGYTAENMELAELIRRSGLGTRINLLGLRRDVAEIYPALDLFVSSSAGEGFPNAVGEAMAAGVPCVVTDVGDCRTLVGETGAVVPPGDPRALAAAWGELLDRPTGEREKLGGRARSRIEERFSIRSARERYRTLWRDVAVLSARD